MKFSVIFVIIALLFIVTSGKKTAPKCNPLTLKCRCSNVPSIVCGVSGKTHVNPCIANCFGDKVKHVGPCTNQCHNTNKKCAYKSFGHDGGKRLQCCDQVKVCFGKTCTESLKHCIWKGDVLKKKKIRTLFLEKKEKEVIIKELVVNGQKFAKVIVEKEQEDVILQQKDVNGQEEQLEQEKIKNVLKYT